MLELFEKQREVLSCSGHLLIMGGPGSGKTTVAVVKADALVSGALRPGQQVLFLSFARATVARVVEALNDHSRDRERTRRHVDIDTYHAFFWRLVKTHGYLIGLPRMLRVLTPAAQAVALSEIRKEFGSAKHRGEAEKIERANRERAELRRLAFETGTVCFDMFAPLAAEILNGSEKIRRLVSSAYPFVILDEFQDTNAGQWSVVQRLGVDSTMIALADPEQRIYDFIGADPERLAHFRTCFKPTVFDLGEESHRSAGTDIARFGNDLLTGQFETEYRGIVRREFPANQNQAMVAVRTEVLRAIARLRETGPATWSLAVLVPTKQLMRRVSSAFLERTPWAPAISHRAAIDVEGVILAAELVAFLLQPRDEDDFKEFVELLCNFYRGRGGDEPSATDIYKSDAIKKAFVKAVESRKKGKEPAKNSIIRAVHEAYRECSAFKPSGDPDKDWLTIRTLLARYGGPRLMSVAEELRNVRLLDRGTQLREAMSLAWRNNGVYKNALQVVRGAFVQEHFAAPARPESGVVVMNMHKAKGKQFDEVIIFEGWPVREKHRIVANPDRIVPRNRETEHIDRAKFLFRVSVTRARTRTTILTPQGDPCILLPQPRGVTHA